jgi:aminopeptidase S
MVGSPNAEASVYSDGSPRLERALSRADGRGLEDASTGGASDHTSFQRAGIPVSGLYTGASEEGPGGRPYDPCYHRACDTLRNVDRRVLLRMTRSALRAVRSLAGR